VKGFVRRIGVNNYTFPVAAVHAIEKLAGLSLSTARLEILRLKKYALTMAPKKLDRESFARESSMMLLSCF